MLGVANMAIVTSPSVIVPEVLEKDNYERWSILMKQYLAAQDLWDVVHRSKMPRGRTMREWEQKKALALHTIGISCGTEAFEQIKKTDSAKVAWDTLAAWTKPSIAVTDAHDISKHHQRRQAEHEEKLQKLVCHEPISDVEGYLRDHPDAKSPQMLDFALKHAITCGRKNMAHYLYGEISLDFLRGDNGFFLLEHCITKRMFDIAWDLLYHFPELAFEHPSNSTPIISTLAKTAHPFLYLNELGSWGRWIYNSTRVKAFPIKPKSPSAGNVGIVQDMLKKWICPVLYKFHLFCVVIGLLCWMPCWLSVRMEGIGMLFELFLFIVVPLLKLDLVCVLIGVPLLAFLVPSHNKELSLILFLVFILLLVLQRVLLRKWDMDRFRIFRLFRLPIGGPLLGLGLLTSLFVGGKLLRLLRVIQKYKQKLMDEYALEVIRSICGSISELKDENLFVQSGAVEATFHAIENDIPEIASELLKKAEDKILGRSIHLEDSRNMFAYAIAYRQKKVARFLYEVGARKNSNMVTDTDEDGNNILHVAAQLAPHSRLDSISGAALQLQSELHWFKSVEGIVPRFYNMKNKDGETPTQVFLKEHKNLLKEAEGWMKKVAESCTVVGALVITIMFAAAFTVPGGNNQDTGFPIILNKTMTPPSSADVSFAAVFKVFAVSDAISLFAASSSLLMFLGILTSRYACPDFYISLPRKLIIGLSSLFISIAAMMYSCHFVFIAAISSSY
ncbi:hypothetical protein SLA2020_251430 [Shorea laevis]